MGVERWVPREKIDGKWGRRGGGTGLLFGEREERSDRISVSMN